MAARSGSPALIRAVAAVPGIARVRYATSHPGDMSDDLIDAHRDVQALAPSSPSAGSIRLRPGAEGDEPPPSRRRLSRHRRARARGAAGHRLLVRFHRRLSGRNRRRFRGNARARPRRRFRLVLRLQIFGPARNPRRRGAGQIDAATKESAARQASGADRGAVAGLQSRDRGPARSRCCSRSPAGARARSIGRSPYMQAVFAEAPQSLIGVMAEVEIVGVEPHSLRGRVVSPAS